jgi:hypothetical protein
MERMRFRKLRIAWSVVCGILCLLLIALWVSSYRWSGSFSGRGFRSYHVAAITSECGCTGLIYRCGIYRTDETVNWRFNYIATTDYRYPFLGGYRFDGQSVVVMPPNWLAITMVVGFAAIPWLPYFPSRFSLRTLLIATTLVAVALGFIVWMTSR